MSGLVAIVSRAREVRVSDGEIDEMARAYESLRGEGTREEAKADEFARVIKVNASAGPPGAPRAQADDGGWVMTVGIPHADANGTELSALDGQFVWSSYDPAREELSIASDPFGMHALYATERDGKAYLSTSALALARHVRARPNPRGLAVYLRAGYQFGSVTNWEGIERVEPGTRVTFTREGPVRDVYWMPSLDGAVTELDLTETARHCISVAAETYGRYYGGSSKPSWSDLTGGYDSRLLALLLREAGVDFAADTAGDERNVDVQIAERVARAAGWDWARFDVPGDWGEVLPRLLPMAVAWGDCHLDALQLAEVLWGHIEKARVRPWLYTGGGGEHFRSYAWEQEFLAGGRTTQVNLDNWVDMKMLKPVSTEVFVRDPSAEVRDDLLRRMAARAQPYSCELNTVQLDILYAYKCTGHFGAYMSAAYGVINSELPFYLKPVFGAAFSASHRNRGAHRLMRRMIELLDPQLAAIETAKGGPAQTPRLSNLHRFAPYYGKLARKAAWKFSERVLRRPMLLPAAPTEPIRAAARGALVDSLDDGRALRWRAMRARPLFKRTQMDELLARAGEAGLKDGALLGRILTVELALRAADAALEE